MEVSSSDEDEYVWQVRAGKPGSQFWKTVDEDLADILEEAFQRSSATCQWEYDRWYVYTYDMVNNVQTSQRTGTERDIKRIPWSQVRPNRGDENGD